MFATVVYEDRGRVSWLRRARRVARAVRHTPDRLLHGYRRWRARRRHGTMPESILFVCYGNICRSPYAAASFARLAGSGRVRIASAGFIGPGRPAPPEALTVSEMRGVDLSAHRSQVLTPELLEAYELVVVMAREQREELAGRFGRTSGVVVLGDLDPGSIDTRTILDPYSRSEEVFAAVYDRIDRCLDSLAGAWGNGASGAAADPDRPMAQADRGRT